MIPQTSEATILLGLHYTDITMHDISDVTAGFFSTGQT